jgi:diguanylate cyclase (GGDEF)-like protein
VTGSGKTSTAAGLLQPFLPWLVLFSTLCTTWFVWDHERQINRRALRSQFEFALRETVSRIEQHAAGYEQMLRGLQALYATTHITNRSAMNSYVETLQLDANFSGVQVVGIAESVSANRRQEHIAAMRGLGFADYAIHPDSQALFFAPVVQREPYVGRNRAPIGFDLWSDPVRRIALEKARDSGMAAVSGKVRLAVDPDVDARPGFSMYLPIYARGQPHENIAQRREHLAGWVYASFHMNDFMASLYGTHVPGLSLAIYDGVLTDSASLLYESDKKPGAQRSSFQAALSATEYMVIAGRSWTLSLSTQEEFETRLGHGAQSVIVTAGMGLSVLLALLTWLMVTGRARALRLAAGMTEELRHMAQHDALTHLPNRALFSDRLSHELSRAKRHGGRFAIIFLDLDHFKPVNDKYGHAVGDQLLRQVADRLKAAVRKADTVARIGGDEFVLLMPELSENESVFGLATKVQEALRDTFVIEGHDLSISCSIGVSVYPQDGNEADALTKSADESMYLAKESGRNCIKVSEPGLQVPTGISL